MAFINVFSFVHQSESAGVVWQKFEPFLINYFFNMHATDIRDAICLNIGFQIFTLKYHNNEISHCKLKKRHPP